MNWQWQMVGEDEWDFGEVVRGMIRHPKGCIYFDEEKLGPEGGWVWFIFKGPRGIALSKSDAAYYVEEALGIIDAEKKA